MQLNDVASLVKLLDKSSLTEISFSDETSKVTLKKETFKAAPVSAGMLQMPMTMPAMPAPAAPAAAASAAPAEAKGGGSKFKEVTSPMVGTFYASSSPGAAPLIAVGAAVRPGMVLCIIE